MYQEWNEIANLILGEASLLARVLPTRVRRSYSGGTLLDRMEGNEAAYDPPRPESWIGSTVIARNHGLDTEEGEGITQLRLADGAATDLVKYIASNPRHALGTRHVDRLGCELGFVAKLLDSDMRLQVQAHPTTEFARSRMDMPFGKLEVYYVLSVGERETGYIWLGFQRPPTRERWRRIVEEQRLGEMEACFDPIPVRPGEVWVVPGGLPHAIGEGVLMVEVMEPSDLVVRCEFERQGCVVPPEGRYMGRDLEFCLDVFDYAEYSLEEVQRRFRLQPQRYMATRRSVIDTLVDSRATDCFEMRRIKAYGRAQYPLDGRASLVVLTNGAAIAHTEGNCVGLRKGDACFIAAAAWEFDLHPLTEEAEALVIHPGEEIRLDGR